MLERDREVEEQASNEKEIPEPAAAYGCHDQAGNNERRAQYGNAPIDGCGTVCEDGFRPYNSAFW
jgi:hypothetical protein